MKTVSDASSVSSIISYIIWKYYMILYYGAANFFVRHVDFALHWLLGSSMHGQLLQ